MQRLLWIKQLLGGKEIEDASANLYRHGDRLDNFLIFVCAIIVRIFFMQILVGLICRYHSRADGELTMATAIISVCILHIPMLAVFSASARLPTPLLRQLNSMRMHFGQALPRLGALRSLCSGHLDRKFNLGGLIYVLVWKLPRSR